MKKYMVIFVGLLLVLGFTSGNTQEIKKALLLNDISGQRLWEKITIDGDYKEYSHFPNLEGIQDDNHHGKKGQLKYYEVFINSILKSTLPAKDGKAPNGTIIVKENYNAKKELKAIAVMAKIDGYNPKHNDWFWAKIAPNGKIIAEGKLKPCIKCHLDGKSNDFIMSYKLSGGL